MKKQNKLFLSMSYAVLFFLLPTVITLSQHISQDEKEPVNREVLLNGIRYDDSNTKVLDNSLNAVTERVLVTKYINSVLKKPKKISNEDIIITSPDDRNYKNGVHPESFSVWTKPIRYTIRKSLRIKGTWIYLFLKDPIKPGKSYNVEIKYDNFYRLDTNTGRRMRGKAGPVKKLSFTWPGDNNHSSAISVNQLGYMSDKKKFGYLTQYCGAKNGEKKEYCEIVFNDVHNFKLVDAETGEKYFEGKIELAPACKDENGLKKDRLSDTIIRQMDFSEFRTPGRYRITVPGVGTSYPFSIRGNIYNEVFGVLMRGLYHQRCGTELTKEFTRHTHPACHLKDAEIPDIFEYENEMADFIPQKTGKHMNCTKGHHDAGDYGKYLTNGTLLAYYILQGFEVMPEKLNYDNTPLPEAGDGIPDLIQEAKWELDWISSMQDDDGAFFTIVTPHSTMSYQNSLAGKPKDKFKKARKLWWKDIHVTAAGAAVLARAARTESYIENYPGDAEKYIKQAEKAWKLCMKYTDPDEGGKPVELQPGHHYGHFLGALDEYCWMAVELWLTTGKKKYHDYFLKHHNPDDGWEWGWWPLKDASGAATRSYIFGKRAGKNSEMLKKCRDSLLNSAKKSLASQKEWATRCAFALEPFNFGRWGWLFLGDISSYDLMLASTIVDDTKKREYIQAACYNADQELGNNPDSQVFISGIGCKRPVDHVHQSSRYDGIIEPIPGIPMGFYPNGYNLGKSERKNMASFTVGGLPPAYRYVDCWYITQEFTVPNLTTTTMAYAMLGKAGEQKSGKPKLSITANGKSLKIEGRSPLKIRFKANAEALNGKEIRDYYWDLENEEFGTDREFIYTYEKPGIYNVACTVTDSDGWINYKYIAIKVSQPVNKLPENGQQLKVDDKTIYLWHFNTETEDATSNPAVNLKGKAQLSSDNLMWMKNPSGKAVKFRRKNVDEIFIKFDRDILNDPKLKNFRIEAIVNYEADVPRGNGHSRIMYLANNTWNTILGLIKDQWNGKFLRGCSEKDSTVANVKIKNIFKPTPGWHIMFMELNKETGKAKMGFAGKELEFNYEMAGAGGKTEFQLGGFEGYVDELKVSAEYSEIPEKNTEENK